MSFNLIHNSSGRKLTAEEYTYLKRIMCMWQTDNDFYLYNVKRGHKIQITYFDFPKIVTPDTIFYNIYNHISYIRTENGCNVRTNSNIFVFIKKDLIFYSDYLTQLRIDKLNQLV